MRFIPLEKLINLEEGYRREFRIDYHRLLLLQYRGDLHLIEAVCPHQEHPLAEAHFPLPLTLRTYRWTLSPRALFNFLTVSRRAEDNACSSLGWVKLRLAFRVVTLARVSKSLAIASS